MSNPLVVHIVYRFDVGGLENGVVNLINRMTGWRHVVVALTEAVPAFCARVQRDDVRFLYAALQGDKIRHGAHHRSRRKVPPVLLLA